MSYATEKQKFGTDPLVVCEIDLGYCSLSNGIAPCVANPPPGKECYNTERSCQDLADYTEIIKTYRFSQPRSNLPLGINMHPVIIGTPDFTPTKAPPYGLSDLGKVTITLQNFPDTDLSTDKYAAIRSYDPYTQGTFLGKLAARNYFNGRELRVLTGYITEPFDWANFETRTYVIDRVEGPDPRGRFKITAFDRLQLAADDQIQIPALSTGTLASGITAGSTTATLAGDETQYPAGGGTIRIGDEILTYASRTGTTLNSLAQAQWGTESKSHDAGDTVQLCRIWQSVNGVDITHEILTQDVGIDASKIPYDAGLPAPTGTPDEWDENKSVWLSTFKLTAIISEPTGAKTLLAELAEHGQFALFVDQKVDKVKMRMNTPPLGNAPIPRLTDDTHLEQNRTRVKEDPKQQVTQVWVYYDKINHSKRDDVGNFRTAYLAPDPVAESRTKRKKVKVIKSRWLGPADGSQAAQLAGRLKARFAYPPTLVNFTLNAKDSDLWTGDLAELSSRFKETADGSADLFRMQILSVDEDGTKFHYQAISSQYIGFYAFIGPDALLPRNSETEANVRQYAYIAGDNGYFSNGDPADKII